MKFSPLLGLIVGGLAGIGTANIQPRNFDANDYYVLHLERDTRPDDVASRLGLRHEGSLGELADHHVFSTIKSEHNVVRRALQEWRRKRSLGDEADVLDGIQFSQKQKLRAPMQKRVIPPLPPDFSLEKRIDTTVSDPADAAAVQRQQHVMKTLGIADPIFHKQWHLFNSAQPGHDVNVTDVWLSGVTGKNATVAIVDDGLDMYSNDLKDNYYAEGSYDFNDHQAEPRPVLSDDRHGTRCAGEIGAGKNDVCGVGVAYDSKIAGIRILSKLISDADEAIAMNYDFQHNQIYSCSWGPPDDGRSMEAPGVLIKRAMLNGVQNGRDKLGSIFVFASGNGAASEDNCNFDGYTNSIYSITVGAVDRKGLHPYYSEKCSAQLVVTYSSGSGDTIHTTDVGENTCSDTHGGTSAAAPLAAGIFALALDVRPDLSWRDMQYIALHTAVPIDLEDDERQKTALGKEFSHTFGYGKIDSWGLVELAKTWKKVKPQAWYYSPWLHVKHEIPEGEEGLKSSFEVTEDMLKEANLERLEHVTVTMNVEHGCRGDLSVDLISPSGLVSHISATRKMDKSDEGYQDWTFMTVVHWGESGVGTWSLVVRDTKVNEFQGTFVDWQLKLWGESIDPSKAKVLPMPSEDDDDDHDEIATSTAGVATTSLPPVPTDTSDVSIPTDNPQRPTKPPKPGDATQTDTDTPKPTGTESAAADETSTAPEGSNWVPSFLPSFGVSSRTQAWIYGSLGLIVVFCCGLGAWLWWARRKRLRNNPHDKYEFEPLNPSDDGDVGGGGGGPRSGNGGAGPDGANGEKTGSRRGGELYDAFAGGSDDEEDLDDLLSPHPGAGIGAGPRSRSGSSVGDDSEDERDGGSGDGDRAAGRGQGANSRLLT